MSCQLGICARVRLNSDSILVLIRLIAEQDLSLTTFVAGAMSIILNTLTTSDSMV